jgi:transposase
VVFGIFKRKGKGKGKVYTKIVDDTRSRTLVPVIEQKIAPDSIVYTDSYSSSMELRTPGVRQSECCEL